MHNDMFFDELRRIESDVVEGERQLAKQEALVVALQRQGADASKACVLLDELRQNQRERQQERLRLLVLLQR